MNRLLVSVSFAAVTLLWPATAMAAPEGGELASSVMPAAAPDAAPVESTATVPPSAEPANSPSEPVAPPPPEAPVTAAPDAPSDSTPAAPATAAQPAPATAIPAPAAAESAKPPQATPVATADAAVAEKIRALIEGKLAQYVSRERDRAGVLAFYKARSFAPLWVANNAAGTRAKGATTFLQGVAADGLDAADYPTPAFAGSDPEQLAADELKLTNSALTFVRHASIGRIAFTRASGAVYFDQKPPDPADVLGKIAGATDVRAALDAYNPQHPAYKALKTALATARSGASGPVAIPAPAPTKQSGKHKGKAKLKEATPKQESRSDRIDTIIANMERWRWMPHVLGADHVMVNIPDYTLKVVDSGKTAWTTKIVVGKPGSHATPLLTETMKYITVNPTWNVPPSIIRNEYLPALARDPGALARIGLRISHNSDGSIRIYQPPGERNALGRIRFNFPNRFLVYQHDTPDKHLFAHNTRAYSHGCMRVQNPDQYAQVLLSVTQPGDGYTANKIRSMYGNGERNITLKKQLPVYITYQTAFVDSAGKLETRPDIYGIDKDITRLRHEDRKNLDVPVARNYNSTSKPVAAAVRTPRASRHVASGLPPAAEPQNYGWGWGGGYQQYDRFRTW